MAPRYEITRKVGDSESPGKEIGVWVCWVRRPSRVDDLIEAFLSVWFGLVCTFNVQ